MTRIRVIQLGARHSGLCAGCVSGGRPIWIASPTASIESLPVPQRRAVSRGFSIIVRRLGNKNCSAGGTPDESSDRRQAISTARRIFSRVRKPPGSTPLCHQPGTRTRKASRQLYELFALLY